MRHVSTQLDKLSIFTVELCKHGDDQIQKFYGQDRCVADLFIVVKRQLLWRGWKK
jgi:hypothetical protein